MGRLAAAALSLGLLLGAGTAPARGGSERPLLGLVGEESYTLVRIDPQTLRPLRGSALRVGSVASWSFSPDRSRLAVVTHGPPARCPRYALRFFDARTMRLSGKLAINGGGLEALAWLRVDRLLAVRSTCEGSTSSFVVIDPVARRVVKSEPIEGSLVRLVPSAGKLVGLVASRNAIAPSRLLIFDVDGVVRAQTLEEIPAGAQPGPREVGRYARPGLAVDAEHAFVVSTGGLVAEVDLGTLAVSYHRLVRRTLSAPTKASEGWSLKALWLGNGLLAFSGKAEEVWTTAEGVLNLRDRPAGLSAVDTRSWNLRTIDREAEWFVRADRLLYAMRHSWDSSTQTTTGMGVAAYDFDGGTRFHVVPHALASLALVYRGRAYVRLARQGGRFLVVDVASGRVLGTRAAGLPRLLREQASPFWGNGY